MRYIPNSNNVQAQNAVRQSADRNSAVNRGVTPPTEPKHDNRQRREQSFPMESGQQKTSIPKDMQQKRADVSENHPNPPKPVQSSHPKQQSPAEAPYKSNSQQNKAKPSTGAKNSGGTKGITSLLYNLLPPSVYNHQSKKLFGFLSAEDLLLLALIFLFAESDSEDSSLLSLALMYILVSEHFDLPDLLF